MRFPDDGDIPGLKKLWNISFGDDYEYIDEFFRKAFEKQNALCICDGESVVSALYLIENSISKDGNLYKAYYVYAVATHPQYRGRGLMRALVEKADDIARQRDVSYLFLVPGNESLYEMYEKFGYKKGFFCSETVVKGSVPKNSDASQLDYTSYLKCHDSFPLNESVIFGEKGFNIFLSSEGEGMRSVYIENIGYCVYEKTADVVTVYELFGDRDIILNEVFSSCRVDSVRLRTDAPQGGIPCGMYKSFGDAPKLNSAFLGAYGG